MATTENNYIGNGTLTSYTFSFPYIKKEDVKVTLDEIGTTDFTINDNTPTLIDFNTVPPDGVAIRIFRETDTTATSSTFFPGSAIRAQDLNRNFEQSLFIGQEDANKIQDVISGGIADGSVTTAKIADDAVTAAKLGPDVSFTPDDGSITAAKLANNAVTTAKLANNAVTTAKLVDADVTTAKLANNAVTAAKLANNAVTTAKLVDANVTTAKLADANVTTAKLADANVTTAKLADANVTTAKLANNAVTTAKLADANVTAPKIESPLSSALTFASSQTFPNIPANTRTSAYTLVATDAGKHINITTGGITVPSGVFSVGDVVSIYNNSNNNQTITKASGVTLRGAGTASTSNRTLAQYGLATILCVASNVFVITGSGLT